MTRIKAEIIGDIWIDDVYQRGPSVPPIGYFIPDKRYYFVYEFDVPENTPSWGTEFTTDFLINGVVINSQGCVPGASNGKNYGVYYTTFKEEGEYLIEISGKNKKQLNVVVKKNA
ncbi:MAG: hypothetical protein BWY45_02668 [Euryarchaeota archaeon ADurb.Bin294]|nr:MAG: hypothetical protein BWY45_02668 [Euryarchaeota archaeon ADurb.Bin294]HOW34415.1 hypothetical protein [Methanoregulaceae archaeon]